MSMGRAFMLAIIVLLGVVASAWYMRAPSLATEEELRAEAALDYMEVAFPLAFYEEHDLGILGGALPDWSEISYGFLVDEIPSIEVARSMVVKIANGVLEELNSNPMVREYLPELPYSADRLKVTIWQQPARMDENSDQLVGVRLYKGSVEYEGLLSLKPRMELCILRKESLEEARSIILQDAGDAS